MEVIGRGVEMGGGVGEWRDRDDPLCLPTEDRHEWIFTPRCQDRVVGNAAGSQDFGKFLHLSANVHPRFGKKSLPVF